MLPAAFLAIAVGAAAWRLRWLTAGGAVAAVVVGGVVFGCCGWPGAGALLTFFVTATLLGRGKHAGPRNARQVIANGGFAALAAGGVWSGVAGAWPAVVASLAAANADTWATELGMRFGRRPLNVLTLRPVEPGASGGISLAGLAASAAGALLIAAWSPAVVRVAATGFVAALLDSVLGAGLQAKFRCGVCGREVETPRHHDARCTHLRGILWMDNDVVNLIASACAGLVAWLQLH